MSVTWACGHCGTLARCAHLRQDRVALDDLAKPRRGDEFFEPVQPKRRCTCKHEEHIHQRHAGDAAESAWHVALAHRQALLPVPAPPTAPGCSAVGCRCAAFKCETCGKAPCACRVEHRPVSFTRGKRRVQAMLPRQSELLAANAQSLADLARVARVEQEERAAEMEGDE